MWECCYCELTLPGLSAVVSVSQWWGSDQVLLGGPHISVKAGFALNPFGGDPPTWSQSAFRRRFLSHESKIESPAHEIAALHAAVVQVTALGRMAVLFAEADAEQFGALVEAYMALPRPYEDIFAGRVTVAPDGPQLEDDEYY